MNFMYAEITVYIVLITLKTIRVISHDTLYNSANFDNY